MKWFIVALMLLAAGYGWLQSYQVSDWPDGILVENPPVQTSTQVAPFQYNDLIVTPLAEFSVTGRVVGARRYDFDAQAMLHAVVKQNRDLLSLAADGQALSPIDLGLTWGKMSDNRYLEQVDFAQSGRFLSWRPKAGSLPLPEAEFNRLVANMHMIPSNAWVREALLMTHVGHIVSFEGYLVRLSNPAGFYWSSSLTRDDTGDGACEVVWVTRFEINTDN